MPVTPYRARLQHKQGKQRQGKETKLQLHTTEADCSYTQQRQRHITRITTHPNPTNTYYCSPQPYKHVLLLTPTLQTLCSLPVQSTLRLSAVVVNLFLHLLFFSTHLFCTRFRSESPKGLTRALAAHTCSHAHPHPYPHPDTHVCTSYTPTRSPTSLPPPRRSRVHLPLIHAHMPTHIPTPTPTLTRALAAHTHPHAHPHPYPQPGTHACTCRSYTPTRSPTSLPPP